MLRHNADSALEEDELGTDQEDVAVAASSKTADSLSNVGDAHWKLRAFSKALQYYEQALKMRQALYPGNHPDVAASLNNVGLAYQILGRVVEGLIYHEQALKMRQTLYEDDHPDVASSLHNVGIAYQTLGYAGDGLAYQEQALKMRQALYQGDHPDVAESLHNMGVACQSLGDVRKGLTYYEQALRMRKALYEDDHPDVAVSLYNVGVTYQTLGDARNGLAYKEQALRMRQSLYLDDHPDIATSLHSVGVAYEKLVDIRKGLTYYEQALKMRWALYQGNHPDIATSLSSVGVAYGELVDIRKGLAYQEQALKMRQALYRGDHPDVARSLHNVGAAYQRLGDAENGLSYKEQALKMMQGLYPGGHHDVAVSLNSVGFAYEKLGNIIKGLAYKEQALKMRQALYPGDHHDVASSLHNVGIAYQKLGYAGVELAYQEQALKMRQALYPGGHHDVTVSLYSVGFAYEKLGDIRKGITYYEQALEMNRALYPGDHPNVAGSLHNVGAAYQRLGDIKEGLTYCEQALKMRQALYPASHPDIAASLNNVGVAYKNLGDIGKYNLYSRQAASIKGFINKRGETSLDVIAIKQKIQKTLNKIHELSSKGRWSNKYIGQSNCGVSGYLKKSYLKKQLGDMYNALNLNRAMTLCFEAINIGIANNEQQNLVCAIKFTKSYPVMIREIVREHPEYFILENIAKACLSEEAYGLVVSPAMSDQKKDEEFKGGGMNDAGSYPPYHNSALDLLLELRLKDLVGSNVILLKSRPSFAADNLAHDVSVAFSTGAAQTILVPVNLYNKHWVGLVFRNVGMVEVTYLDSEQETMPIELKNALSVYFYQNKVLEPKLEKQRYNNCGFELVEYFYYYLTSSRGSQESALYIHSMLLENTLLDPEIYQLQIEENKKLMGFLSNEALMLIKNPKLEILDKRSEMDSVVATRDYGPQASSFVSSIASLLNIDLLYKKILYRDDLKRFEGIVEVYGIDIPNGLTAIDVLRSDREFKRKVLLKVSPDKNPKALDQSHKDTIFVHELRDKLRTHSHIGKILDDKIQKVNAILHKTSLAFKGLDFAVDFARLINEPTLYNAKKLALDCTYLYSMNKGINGYSAIVGGTEALYHLSLGDTQLAFNTVTATLNAMALPYIFAYSGNPYLSFAYGAYMAVSIGHEAIMNVYSFVLELGSEDEILRSTTAYRDLTRSLLDSPLQRIYDFDSVAKGYEIQVNNILCARAKLSKKVQLEKEHGEFGKKLFEYIYNTMIEEQCSLANKIISGIITEQEAELIRTKHIAISSQQQSYEHCMEIKNAENDISNAIFEQYYCFNIEGQLLDHVIISDNNQKHCY